MKLIFKFLIPSGLMNDDSAKVFQTVSHKVAAVVHNELQQNEKFLSDFKRSVGYLKAKILCSRNVPICD